MTTNVVDNIAKILASDSRWSQRYGNFIVYVDDTGFDKIELIDSSVFVFAGKGLQIQNWKNWIRSNPTDIDSRPSVDYISICIVDRQTKAVTFHKGQNIVLEDGLFAGTGSQFAYPCWTTNRNAVRSVNTAASFDPATGGEVKFINLMTGLHNLNQPYGSAVTDIRFVDQAIITRGMVMKITVNQPTPAPFKLKDAAASNDELAEVVRKLDSGELSADAPCDGANSVWTDEEVSDLNLALNKAFGF